MFDEKYIMTGILSMALIAAWQKPSLFREHIVNKIMILTVAVLFLFITWSAALQVSIEALPSSLNEEQIAETKKNIEAFLVPMSSDESPRMA